MGAVTMHKIKLVYVSKQKVKFKAFLVCLFCDTCIVFKLASGVFAFYQILFTHHIDVLYLSITISPGLPCAFTGNIKDHEKWNALQQIRLLYFPENDSKKRTQYYLQDYLSLLKMEQRL